MKSKVRHILFVAFIVTLAVAMAACAAPAAPGAAPAAEGEAEAAAPAEGEAGEGNLEIFSWWISGGEVEALDAVYAIFSEKYPNVTIENAALASD